MIEARFGESSPFSLGVEEEVMILDAETFAPVAAVQTLVEESERLELPGRLKPELHASVVELNTEMLHPHLLQKNRQLHDATSSYTDSSRRSTRNVSRQSFSWNSGTRAQPEATGRIACVATSRSWAASQVAAGIDAEGRAATSVTVSGPVRPGRWRCR